MLTFKPWQMSRVAFFTYQSRLGLPVYVSPYLLQGYGWHILTSTLNSPAHELGSPSQRLFWIIYNPDILVPCYFCTFGLLEALPGSPLSPPLPSWPSSCQSCPRWTLPVVTLLCSIIKFLLHHTKEQSCPFLSVRNLTVTLSELIGTRQ